jgi:hypothetical protein
MRVALALAMLAIALPSALYLHQRQATLVSLVPCTTSLAPETADDSVDGGRITGCDASYRLKQGRTYDLYPQTFHPQWEDPAALAIAIGSLAIGAAIIGAGRRKPLEVA